MKHIICICWLCILTVAPSSVVAHSGKARFHAIIDTDCAADDLRAVCMLLGNREVEVLAVVTSKGALATGRAATYCMALLTEFHHEGIPVGCGADGGFAAPPWRNSAEQVEWSATTPTSNKYRDAAALIAQTLRDEPERVTYIALGSLTNLAEVFTADPSLHERIERVVWYNDDAHRQHSANYAADPQAVRTVLASGVKVDMVSAASPIVITVAALDTVATIATRYARKIAATHSRSPLEGLVHDGHLQCWDDLVVAYLFAPELFDCRAEGGSLTVCTIGPDKTPQLAATLAAVLRGKVDSESRVFFGFPTAVTTYADDVQQIINTTLERHGTSEWRAGVLTNELHGHLGIYATIGVKMGIRAREYFNIGVDDIRVTTFAGRTPPVSCMNDGVQVSTGATVGHGLIEVADVSAPIPEAVFEFKGKRLRLRLNDEYAERVRRDIQRGVELYGMGTEQNWQYVRRLALQYWRDWNRNEIFDATVLQ